MKNQRSNLTQQLDIFIYEIKFSVNTIPSIDTVVDGMSLVIISNKRCNTTSTSCLVNADVGNLKQQNSKNI